MGIALLEGYSLVRKLEGLKVGKTVFTFMILLCMSQIKQFEDLEIWKKAIKLAVDIYKISNVGLLKSDFGMKDQIRRAAISISNNIAEGFEYNNNSEFIRFLNYAKGSCGEVRNQVFILKEIQYIELLNFEELNNQCIELSKQISSFIKYLKEFNQNNKKPS